MLHAGLPTPADLASQHDSCMQLSTHSTHANLSATRSQTATQSSTSQPEVLHPVHALQFGFGPMWLALMNAGGVRASIQAPSGAGYPYSITQNDVLTVLPVRQCSSRI
jgi:hypothetical protein